MELDEIRVIEGTYILENMENDTLEYKESFNFKALAKYSKTMAAFANKNGGTILFGIKNDSRAIVGLLDEAFERFKEIDNAILTQNLKDNYSPEINWKRGDFILEGKRLGYIKTYSCKTKPIVCTKTVANVLQESAIYYRYNAQTSVIKPTELFALINNEIDKINRLWVDKINTISTIGVDNISILDHTQGKLIGDKGTLFIDESLLSQISFIKEGSFVETGGDPALIIKGEVQTVVGGKKILTGAEIEKAINLDTIILSFLQQKNVSSPNEYIGVSIKK